MSFSFLLMFCVFVFSSFLMAQNQDYHKLKVQDFQMLLGNRYPIFRAGLSLAKLRNSGADIDQLTAEQIKQSLLNFKVTEKIVSIQMRRSKDESYNYLGWVITFEGGLKLAIRTRGSLGVSLLIGHSQTANDLEWFNVFWYDIHSFKNFRADLVIHDVRTGSVSAISKLEFFGAYYEPDGMRTEEFGRSDFRYPIKRTVLKPPYKALEEIYELESSRNGKTLQEIRAIREKTGRAVLAVFDSGVDYNHPEIAFKLAIGPDRSKFEVLKNKLQMIEAELADIQGQSSVEISAKERIENLIMQKKLIQRILSNGSRGWDFASDQPRPYDFGRDSMGNVTDHGTSVASVAAGSGEEVVVLPIRFIGSDNGLLANADHGKRFEEAVMYAKLYGARVINLSFGFPVIENSDSLERKIRKILGYQGYSPENIEHIINSRRLIRQSNLKKIEVIKNNPDILFVFAAGNDSANANDGSNEAANIKLPNVLTVASIDAESSLSKFSVFGNKSVHLAAFGDVAELPSAGNQKMTTAGTSFAAPMVAHAAGLILAHIPQATIAEVIDLLQQAVVKTPKLKSKLMWGGYLDLKKLKNILTARPVSSVNACSALFKMRAL